MKEMKDLDLIKNYLHYYKIESIFNEHVIPHLSLYTYDQGEEICSQGELSQYIFILVKGKVKIYTTSAEGKTLILSFKTPLEIIGDIEYVQNIPIINTVESVSPVTMIGVHQRWVKKYNKDYSPFLEFLLDIITKKFHSNTNSMSLNLLYPVEVRLASYLLSMTFDDTNTFYYGHIQTTNLIDVANQIGTSYRHLNRVIKDFCTSGLIERGKGCIVIKERTGLNAIASRNIYE